MPGPETLHITAGTLHLGDHGPHGLARSCGTLDSLLLTHGLLPTTGQHGGQGTATDSRLRAAVSE